MHTEFDISSQPIKTLVLAPKRLMRSSLALTLDILETANKVSGQSVFDVDVASTDQFKRAGAGHSIIILPGLGITSSNELDDLLCDPETLVLLRYLKHLGAQGQEILFATSCSGVFLFAEAGLVDKKRVTTSWWLAPLLKTRYPQVQISSRELTVDAGNILTAGAALAQSDLILNLVERFAGLQAAHDCRKLLLIDDRRSQIPYIDTSMLIASDPALRLAETYILQRMAEEITVPQIAAAAKLGQRTFARRLSRIASLTPVQFLQSLRVGKAVQLAVQTHLSSAEIAEKVGYSDGSALRRVVTKQTGKSLDTHRQLAN
ncbi:GlxA family transcriptional regulator [Sulfitobacter sp. R86518]|uniref:GlxA family transcriptional regulator n=1 Tax=Sulfitobacter sp. R86518 TaxID=3093858 RepID=UPI0036D811D2